MEQHWPERPLTFGEVLDVTFRIIKENFSSMFLIMLIFMGPCYILQGIALMSNGVTLLRETNRATGIMSLFSKFTQPGIQGTALNFGSTHVVLIIVSVLLLVIISIPMAHASLIIATEQIRNKQTVNILSCIKRAFSRYWALLGGSIVYGLVVFALYIGMALIIVLYLVIVGMAMAFNGQTLGSPLAPMEGLGIHIIVIIVLTLSSFFSLIYLMTRWGFFFAAIVFEKVSPGLGKSWKLTRGNFWRLVGLNLVVVLLNAIIAFVIQMTVHIFLGTSVLAFLLNSIVSILITMTPVIAYAVIYFDLRVRNEAMDLITKLESYQIQSNSSIPEVAVGQNPKDRQANEQ